MSGKQKYSSAAGAENSANVPRVWGATILLPRTFHLSLPCCFVETAQEGVGGGGDGSWATKRHRRDRWATKWWLPGREGRRRSFQLQWRMNTFACPTLEIYPEFIGVGTFYSHFNSSYSIFFAGIMVNPC
jgi:hypothetical protein